VKLFDFDAIKKKGFRATLLKIPTRRTPRQIEHNMREEFQRGKVIRVLNRTHEFLDSIEALGIYHDSARLQHLTAEITALLRELKAHKK
jgi:hypothetical protein